MVVRHGVGSVEIAISKISEQSAVKGVRAGLGLHHDLQARRTSHGGIEPVGNDLVLVDCASSLNIGWPNDVLAEFCVTCWPSTLICILPLSVAPKGEFCTSLLVMPGTIIANCK
jgi:hypothetical protein